MGTNPSSDILQVAIMVMKKKAKHPGKSQVVASFKHAVTVEIILPVVRPLAAAAALDVQKLSKGSHRVEIGVMEGGCCPKLVRAVIRKGMVTRLEAEPCAHSERVPPKSITKEMSAVLAEVRRRIDQDPWQPVPVSELVSIAQQGRYPTRIGWGAGCIYICIWHYCLFCCIWPPRCWIETRKPDVEM